MSGQGPDGSKALERSATLSIPSDPKYMPLVRTLTGAAAEAVGFNETDVNYVRLAVDEALANIIRHAYDGDTTQRIEVHVGLHDDRIEVRLRDFGKQCDPSQIKPRNLDDIRPGGLGVHFMREIMNEVVYDTSHEVGTELHMTKYLTEGHRARTAHGD